ncbi:MAG: DUF3631 domain-containing protein [Actinomycetota bacterium]
METLREFRKSRGLTVEACAVLAGVDKATVSRVERGLLEPSPRLIVRLSRGLGISALRLQRMISNSPKPEPEEVSLGIRLLADLKQVFGDRDVLSSAEILEELQEIEDAPWADLHGRSLTPRGLAQRLRAFEVRPSTIRRGTQTPKGYRRVDLHDVWKRYLPTGQEAADA